MQTFNSLTCVLALLVFVSCAPQQNPSQQVEIQKKILQRALKYSDLPVARTAYYNIIEQSPKDSPYIDSLFIFYVNTESFAQAVLLGNELIAKNPQDVSKRDLLASSKQSVGLLKAALEDYEFLFKMTNKPYYLYQVAERQFELGRVEECTRSVNQLLAMEGLEKEKVGIRFEQNQTQMVPLKAASFNILGVLARQVNQRDAAIDLFQKAIQVFPDFELAKANLRAMQNSNPK